MGPAELARDPNSGKPASWQDQTGKVEPAVRQLAKWSRRKLQTGKSGAGGICWLANWQSRAGGVWQRAGKVAKWGRRSLPGLAKSPELLLPDCRTCRGKAGKRSAGFFASRARRERS